MKNPTDKPHITIKGGLYVIRIAPEKHVFRDRDGRMTTVLTDRIEVAFPRGWGDRFPKENLALYCRPGRE